jgi:hypothetical protein
LAHGIPARLTPAEGRKFAFTVGAAFAVLGGVLWWRSHPTAATVLGTVGGTLGVLGLAVPAQLGPLQRAWMGLAHLISKVTTPIFMGVVFFVVITPIAFAMRLFGKRPMRVARAASYWVPRDPAKTRGDLTRQF